jgi:predicted TIM-barrel fold metal-dependent hydrolase
MLLRTELDRRSFLRATAAGFTGAVVTGWSGALTAAGADEQTRAPSTIIDTHTHFYDPARPQGVPWPPKDDTLLYRTVLPKDYQALPVPQPVTGTVVVEASPWVEDNQWILDLAARAPVIVGFVGNLPVGTEEFRGHLKRFANHELFRGLRVGGGRLREGLSQPRFMDDLKRLADAGLALDWLGGPQTLSDVARLATKLPKLRIVIDHVANLRIDGKAPPAEWTRGMREAARHKNVFCKVSGLVEGTGRTDGSAPREVDFYRPVLDAVWEAFGADRLIYGSNWPVSARFASLATVQSIVSDYFSVKGTKAVEQVFWRNAKRAYRWIERR